MNQRVDFRNLNELRQISYEINPLSFAQGSVIFSTGMTKVLCSITIENRVPRFLEGQNTGWLTAEYSMLPGATNPRSSRENVPTLDKAAPNTGGIATTYKDSKMQRY